MGDHLASNRQMAFLTGPRQVGKTTTCRALGDEYLNWDNDDHRAIILRGPAAVAAQTGLEQLSERPRFVVFDELHKYRRWKLFLKGFF
ncbi:MAG TPA: AAA family ATPase, partial [Anaerolineales bacterium]|nr:AAA family ATPase [Anaerolineales bacterium]